MSGATTDIHSVCEDNPEHVKMLLNPEPFAKRTVEGDLGVYINKDHLISLIGMAKLQKELQLSESQLLGLLKNYQSIPSEEQIPLVRRLSQEALSQSLNRHAGKYITVYGTSGKSKSIEGKDLTAIKYVIGTGASSVESQVAKP